MLKSSWQLANAVGALILVKYPRHRFMADVIDLAQNKKPAAFTADIV